MTSTDSQVDPNKEEVLADYQNFPGCFESIILATISDKGNPDASCVPYVMDEDKNFYIFVSYLTNHANNLKATGKAGILFAEDEAKTQNIFARKRLSYECDSVLIERTSPEWTQIVDNFQKRFGQIIEVLRNLQDFNVFKLTPKEGRFVSGFGKIYEIKGNNLDNLIPFQKK